MITRSAAATTTHPITTTSSARALLARVRPGVAVAGEQLRPVRALQRERDRQPGGGERAHEPARVGEHQVEDQADDRGGDPAA